MLWLDRRVSMDTVLNRRLPSSFAAAAAAAAASAAIEAICHAAVLFTV